MVLPIEGMGMWGTVYGFLALDRDGNTVRGLTFYEQKETPGLGGEIANPKWQALWVGRKAYDASGRRIWPSSRARPGRPKPTRTTSTACRAPPSPATASRAWCVLAVGQGYAPYLKNLKSGDS
jgi:Na+-transporting NADH:ubiquinone oxidoreductase subunit C